MRRFGYMFSSGWGHGALLAAFLLGLALAAFVPTAAVVCLTIAILLGCLQLAAMFRR